MTRSGFRFPFTTAALVVATLVLAAALVGHVNLIEIPLDMLARTEHRELNSILTTLLLVAGALLVDQANDMRRIKRAATLDSERLRVVQVTMRTVQDIVNNCLNQLQLLRFEAEGHVPTESLTLFDHAIQETAAKLTALGDLQAYAETHLAIGAGLDAPTKPISN